MSDYEKLKKFYDEIDELIILVRTSLFPTKLTEGSKFITWEDRLTRFIIKKYGENSHENKKFKDIRFRPIFDFNGNIGDYEEAYRSGLKKAKAILEGYLEDLKEEESSINTKEEVSEKEINKNYSKVFIVHGHNEELKLGVARIIERQGIEVIILHEQVNQGMTIIEKIEENSDVNCAICLFTADDIGRAKNEKEEQNRARQNVIFETGYFIGKLGRKNVIIIANNDIEIPSDLQGIVYTNDNNWEFDVLKGLKSIGYNIDMNKL